MLFRDEDDKATVLFHSVIYNSVGQLQDDSGANKHTQLIRFLAHVLLR